MNFLKIVKNTFQLLTKFYLTELSAGIELGVWLLIKGSDFYKMLWSLDYMKPAMVLTAMIVPILFAIKEYRDNQKDIDEILNVIFK